MGRKSLGEKMIKLGLQCLTGIDFQKTGHLSRDPIKGKVRRNIDHIVVRNNWLDLVNYYEVGAWDHFTQDGIYMSDHNGVYVDFEI